VLCSCLAASSHRHFMLHNRRPACHARLQVLPGGRHRGPHLHSRDGRAAARAPAEVRGPGEEVGGTILVMALPATPTPSVAACMQAIAARGTSGTGVGTHLSCTLCSPAWPATLSHEHPSHPSQLASTARQSTTLIACCSACVCLYMAAHSAQLYACDTCAHTHAMPPILHWTHTHTCTQRLQSSPGWLCARPAASTMHHQTSCVQKPTSPLRSRWQPVCRAAAAARRTVERQGGWRARRSGRTTRSAAA